MQTLKLKSPAPARQADTEPGSWYHLTAWFAELVSRLDHGDLAGAIEAQQEIERHGFKVTFRRRPKRAREGAR